MSGPQSAVVVGDRGAGIRIDALEQAPPQHLDRFVVRGRVEQGRLAGGDALGFGHLVGDEAVLLAVGVRRAAVSLADRQRVDESRVRCVLDRLEQRGQEGGQLVPCVVYTTDLAQIDGEFVEQDEGRLTTEQLLEGPCTGCRSHLVAVVYTLVAGGTSERVGDLAPWRVGEDAVAERPAVGRVGVLAVERRDANLPGGQQGRVDKLGGVGNALHPARRVNQRDQSVGLTAAVGCVEAEDGCGLAAGSAQAAADVREQALQPASGVCVGEEPRRIDVGWTATAADDRGEIGGEVGVGDRSTEDVLAWLAGLENRGGGHFGGRIAPLLRFAALAA